MKNSNNQNYKKWKFFVISILLSVIAIASSDIFFNNQLAAQTEWEYCKLLEEIKKKPTGVSSVTISSDRTYAEVTLAGDLENKQKVRVNLPNDPNFIKTLAENNIEIRVSPPRPK